MYGNMEVYLNCDIAEQYFCEVNDLNKFKRKLHKDRYGIVRGSIALCLLIALCVALLVSVQVKYNVAAEKNYAALAAQQVTAEFESLIDENWRTLQLCSDIIESKAAEPDIVLKKLTAYGGFSRAEIHSVGNAAASSSGNSIHQDGEELHFVRAFDEGFQLNAWIDADTIINTLESAFPASYRFLIYDVQNGSFLVNTSDFDDAGYYDVLLDLNQNGSMENLLVSAAGEALVQQHLFQLEGGYYIAQQNTSVYPWSIALVIPKQMISNETWNGDRLVTYAILMGLILLVCFMCNTVFVLHRIQLSNRNTRRALYMGEHMTNIIARDAQITTFVYNRPNDSILAWYDGSGLLEDEMASVPRNSLSCLAELCKLVDGEVERIYDALADSRATNDMEIQLRGFSEAHDERVWRLSLHALDENSGIALGSIRDCTQMQLAQDRVEQELKFRASVEKKASAIWTINVSKNRWTAEYSKHKRLLKSLNMQQNNWNDYNADLNGYLREYLHPADCDSFAESMSLSGLMDAFRYGKTEFVQDYRVRGKSDQEFEWHRMRVRIWQDAKTGDVIASLYVFNVDAKKNAELERGERKKMLQQTLTALGGIYQGLYYVDLDNDLVYTARSLRGDVVDRLCMPYRESIEAYISDCVHPQDQNELREFLSAYMLRRNLTEGTHLHLRRYRRRINDDEYGNAQIIVQPARFENGAVKEIVIAIRYINPG